MAILNYFAKAASLENYLKSELLHKLIILLYVLIASQPPE